MFCVSWRSFAHFVINIDANGNPRMPTNLFCDPWERICITDLLSCTVAPFHGVLALLLPCNLPKFVQFIFSCLAHEEVMKHPVHFGTRSPHFKKIMTYDRFQVSHHTKHPHLAQQDFLIVRRCLKKKNKVVATPTIRDKGVYSLSRTGRITD